MTRSNPPKASLSCSALSLRWPDGTTVFDDLSVSFPPGRSGLVGDNGSGKTTLLRLLSGQLTPSSGSVTVTGTLGYLPQNITVDPAQRVEQALGIARARAALRAVEAGAATEEHFTIIGEDWDVEDRATATLHALGLAHVDLDRPVGQLSGGETTLLYLVALLLRRPGALLLDEPTNNLDLPARTRLYQAVDSWRAGPLVIVSHDRDLLDRMDHIAELRSGNITWYGGGWTAYDQAVTAERQAAERTLRTAQAQVRREKRQREEAQTKLARRQRHDKKLNEQRRAPRIVAGARKRSAQESAGKLRGVLADRLQEAHERLDEAAEATRENPRIRVDLPHTAVPAGRTVLTIGGLRTQFGQLRDGNLHVHGPQRLAVVGGNGAGKTTLLNTITGQLAPMAGQATTFVPTRILPQGLDLLDERLTVAENVAQWAPTAPDNHIRRQLARFLFTGARADQPVSTLSGGERFRAALAAIMLATPATQLLILDEPTNNLDLPSVRQLAHALNSFRGALLIASHDLAFLRSVNPTRWLLLTTDLREITPEELSVTSPKPGKDSTPG